MPFLVKNKFGIAGGGGKRDDFYTIAAAGMLDSSSVGLEVIPPGIGLITSAVLIWNLPPLIGDHSAYRIYIVIVVVLLDQRASCHSAVGIKIKPVVS